MVDSSIVERAPLRYFTKQYKNYANILADILHRPLGYTSDDEIMGRLYGTDKRHDNSSNTVAHYNRQDILEQYCISERGLGALENGSPSIFGCLSSYQGSPCSARNASSFLTACMRKKVSSDENLYDLYKRHPYEYAPYPKRQRYPWSPVSYEMYSHDKDLKSSYFRRKPHTDPSRYTWMPSDDESIKMENPKSLLDIPYGCHMDTHSKKHVSFARSHTLTSFDDATSSLSNSSCHINRITKSQERLLDVRKDEGPQAITRQPKISENKLILDKIKKGPMKTQATQTEAIIGRKPLPLTHINLSPRTVQRVKMVSQAAQTNGINDRKLTKSLSEAGTSFLSPSQKEANFFEMEHEKLQRTQSDEPPRSPFMVTSPIIPEFPENHLPSETSSISKSEEHESEDSVDVKKEIFIDFKPQFKMNKNKVSKRLLVKTSSDGVILVDQRKATRCDDGVVPSFRPYSSISHENLLTDEEDLKFVPYFQKAPIKNEGICKQLEENIYSSIDGGLHPQESIDEEFHENVIYSQVYDRDPSEDIWNESQVTVLQVDSGTDNGTVLSNSEVIPLCSAESTSLLTPGSRRRHMLLIQHQQRSSLDSEALDEEPTDSKIYPKIIVDKDNSKPELPSPVQNHKHAKQVIPSLMVSQQRTLLRRRKLSESPPNPAESPLPAIVPDLLLGRTDSCKTNTDQSESTTTDDYITANSGTDSSRKSTSFQGLENHFIAPYIYPQQARKKSTCQDINENENAGSSFDSAKGSLDTFVADDMVVPSVSPITPIVHCLPPEHFSPTYNSCHTSVPQIHAGRSTPSEDSSSCGSYSVGRSTPDLLDRYSVPSENLNKTWSDDEERSVQYSSSGYYESPIEDEHSKRTQYTTVMKRKELHLDLPSTLKVPGCNRPQSKVTEIKVSSSKENLKATNEKPKRSKSRMRSPMQGNRKILQGRKNINEKTSQLEEASYKATSDESSTGREYTVSQISPRKSKKHKEVSRRRSLSRSPVGQRNPKKVVDYQSSSLPSSLSRRKSTKGSKSNTVESNDIKNKSTNSKKTDVQRNSTKKRSTLKAVSAESLRSVSPGSDSVFYSDPICYDAENHQHCLHCGKEVDDPTKNSEKRVSISGQQPDIVQPPEGFEDSPKTEPGRLFKKLEKRLKSEEKLHIENRRHRYRPDMRAKSEERGGGTAPMRSRLRPLQRSPYCSKEHLKSAASSPCILPGAPEEDDDQGVYVACYATAKWLCIDETGEKACEANSTTDIESIRCSSISSTESEHDLSKRYQSTTHRIVHRKPYVDMYKRLHFKTFECDKTIVVQRESDEFGFRIHGSKPVVVTAIESGTPAESSGLEVGDIILTVNGIDVLDRSHSDVVQIAHAGSDTLTMEIARTKYATNRTADEEAAEPPVIYSGYLWKLSGTARENLTRKWIRRWFCLKKNNCLYYYKTDSYKQPLGVVLLFNQNIEVLENDSEPNKPNKFIIYRGESTPLCLAADTAEERNRWAETIGKVINDCEAVDTFLEGIKMNLTLTPSAIKNPDCFGYLIKLGTQWKSWSRRYCILKDGALYFYRDSAACNAFGVALLHGYKVQQSLSPKKYAFEIVPPDATKKYFYFHAESDTDRRRWVSALEYSIGRWIKLV